MEGKGEEEKGLEAVNGKLLLQNQISRLHEHEFTSGLRERSMGRFGERIRRREK